MRWIRFAAAAVNQTPLDWQGNEERLVQVLAAARQAGVDVLTTPELSLTAYGCEDAFFGWEVCERAEASLTRLLPHCRGMAVSLGLPVRFKGALFNSVCLVVDGEVRGCVAKQNLPGDGIHYEPRWFKPWPAGERAEVELTGRVVPFGDLLFQLPLDCAAGGPPSVLRLAFDICEDAWVAHSGRGYANYPVDAILNPSASHFAFAKQETRRRIVAEGSRAHSATYVYASPLGNESGRAIYDGGCLIGSRGQVVAEAPRFSYRPWTLTCAGVDLNVARQERRRSSSFAPDPQDPPGLVHTEGGLVSQTTPGEKPENTRRAAWEDGEHVKEEEFARAVALGLFDYVRKSHSSGCVVSLSGGADSAAVATLVYLAVTLAAGELGEQAMRQRLGRPAAATTEPALDDFLCCVYQSTKNSSQRTAEAARCVAEAVAAKFAHVDVQQTVDSYAALAEEVVGRQLSWQGDDLALQNIQARARAPGVWMVANIRRALLLATSNRSEAAVGYATMDGDTAGGLSPIAGIDKAFLRLWLVWMERQGPEGIGPMPQLAVINEQEPTAELRPQDQGQTDETDLMPYDVLDRLERHAIRDKQPPRDCLTLLTSEFPERGVDRLRDWVVLFFRLWSRNQWKRERYAPSFHLDDENLDPKTWCRFPILSGGFSRELEELAEQSSAPLQSS